MQRFHVMGTSYGGFVAYHMARMWPERVQKVVIASSGINMRPRDMEALLKRAKREKIEELMLPATAGQFRTLMGLSVFKRFQIVPDFLLNDFVHVRSFCLILFQFCQSFTFNFPFAGNFIKHF